MRRTSLRRHLATIREITGGRCMVISVPDDHTEKLIAIVEFKNRADSREEAVDKLAVVKCELTSTISNSRGLSVADLVPAPPVSIPITTSGEVRQAARIEQHRHGQFAAWKRRPYGEQGFADEGKSGTRGDLVEVHAGRRGRRRRASRSHRRCRRQQSSFPAEHVSATRRYLAVLPDSLSAAARSPRPAHVCCKRHSPR